MKLFLKTIPKVITESIPSNKPSVQLDEIDELANSINANMAKDVSVPKDVLDSFKLKNSFNQDIWINDKLNPKITPKLIKIANDFFKDLNLPKEIKVKDIIFTGSLANFNWSKYSDIDLHIILDFDQFDADYKLVEEFFWAQKALWNQEHDIKVFNFPVELYIQDINTTESAAAIYSVLKDKWIKKPKKENFQLDKKAIKDKADKIIYLLRDIRQEYNDKQYQTVVDKIKRLKDKLKQMRNAGLERGGEYSLENLVFKVLRRTPFMDQLDSFKAKAYDKLMSVAENLNEETNGVDFKLTTHEDELKITAYKDKVKIAYISFEMASNMYFYFEDDFSEEQYDELFPNDKFILISSLEVYKGNKNSGIATELMKQAINKSKELGYDRIYLNASPMGSEGLRLNDLVEFYKKFGFKEILHQGNNTQMLLITNGIMDESFIQRMNDKQIIHKQKKDLERKLGRRLLDKEWNNFIKNGQEPTNKKTIELDPEKAAEIQKRQFILQQKINAIKARRFR